MICKSLELECLNGRFFTFEGLRKFIRTTRVYTVNTQETHEDNRGIRRIDVPDHVDETFKLKWNVAKGKEGISTVYDHQEILAKHAIVTAQIYPLRTSKGIYKLCRSS